MPAHAATADGSQARRRRSGQPTVGLRPPSDRPDRPSARVAHRPSVVSRYTAGRSDARGREQVVLTHQAQDAVLGRAYARVPQPGPHLAVPLAVKRATGEDSPDALRQRRIQQRSWRPRTSPPLGLCRSATASGKLGAVQGSTGAGGKAEPLHLLVDSTGLKLCGTGEWLLEKHGTKTRRIHPVTAADQVGCLRLVGGLRVHVLASAATALESSSTSTASGSKSSPTHSFISAWPSCAGSARASRNSP